MKTKHLRLLISSFLALTLVPLVGAEETLGGPKGGRLLDAAPHRAEFYVTPEKKAEIVFYDGSLQPVGPGTHMVTVTAEAPGGRVNLAMEPSASGFVSSQPLPGGDPYRVVVQLRAAPGEKPQNFRIDLNLAHCGECARAEVRVHV